MKLLLFNMKPAKLWGMQLGIIFPYSIPLVGIPFDCKQLLPILQSSK